MAAVQKYANLVELEKMLSNAYFLAKFRFDTAENEPAKNLQNLLIFANFVPLVCQQRIAGRDGPVRFVLQLLPPGYLRFFQTHELNLFGLACLPRTANNPMIKE